MPITTARRSHSRAPPVGNVGAGQRRSFTAIGDTTNTAARLQALAEPGQIIIHPSTYGHIETWSRRPRSAR